MAHRLLILSALGIALCAPSVADAQQSPTTSGRLVSPMQSFDGLTGGEMMGTAWAYTLALPLPENPSFGGGDEPCVRFGDTGKVLMAFGFGAHCTAERGTIFWLNGFSGFCDSGSRPPYFGADEAAQRECVLAYLPPLTESISVTIDGGAVLDFRTSEYAVFAPQQTVDLPPANVMSLRPQTITFTPYGWAAWLTKLPVGRHTIQAVTQLTDGSEHVTTHVIDIV